MYLLLLLLFSWFSMWVYLISAFARRIILMHFGFVPIYSFFFVIIIISVSCFNSICLFVHFLFSPKKSMTQECICNGKCNENKYDNINEEQNHKHKNSIETCDLVKDFVFSLYDRILSIFLREIVHFDWFFVNRNWATLIIKGFLISFTVFFLIWYNLILTLKTKEKMLLLFVSFLSFFFCYLIFGAQNTNTHSHLK